MCTALYFPAVVSNAQIFEVVSDDAVIIVSLPGTITTLFNAFECPLNVSKIFPLSLSNNIASPSFPPVKIYTCIKKFFLLLLFTKLSLNGCTCIHKIPGSVVL